MARLISETTGYSAEFDTLIPELNDIADIREAFIAYHFGVENFDSDTDVPAEDSIHGHIASFKSLLESIEDNAVLTIGGTLNEVQVSSSAGFVTVGLPDNVSITGDLSIGDDLEVTGDISVIGPMQAKSGINIFSNASARNAAITSPTEGILTYLLDTNQFSVYSGSSWVGIESHGTLGGRIDSAEVLALLGL
jgi:hypothetical protein